MNKPGLTPDERTGVVDLSRSVAGEEDPGASIDMTQADTPAPGGQVPPGTPGTGADVCPRCGGSGKIASGTCPRCLGTGKLETGIAGA